jgi:hypothetical protein
VAVEVFGVDAAHFAAYLPHVDVGDGSVVTSARLTEILEGAAARLAGYLTSTYGASAAAEIALGTASVAYRNCQRCVVTLAAPDVLLAAHHASTSDFTAQINDRAEALIVALRRDADSEIGWRPGGAQSNPGAVATSTQSLGLSIDADSQQGRRRFGGRQNGQRERGWVY